MPLTRVMQCDIGTLPIRSGYKLMVHDDSEFGIMVGIFQSALLNEENKVVGIKVARDENPEDIVIINPEDIKTIHHKNGTKTGKEL